MINGQLINTADFSNKGERVEAYKSFLERMYIQYEEFPFEVKSNKFYKDKPITFRVAAWGYYETARGEWRIYIAYRFNPIKHTVQYTWHVGSGGLAFGQPEKNEWIAG